MSWAPLWGCPRARRPGWSGTRWSCGTGCPGCGPRVHAGRLQAWRARQVAEQTRTLSRAAAGYVDAQVAPYADKIGLQRLLTLVEVAVRRHDPDRAPPGKGPAPRAAAGGPHRG